MTRQQLERPTNKSERVRELHAADPTLTSKQLAALVGMSERAAAKALTRLTRQKLTARYGSRGVTYSEKRQGPTGASPGLDRVRLTVVTEPRPRRRADCQLELGERPCPWAGCRYHLALDVNDRGSFKINCPSDEDGFDHMPETCALDVAARGGATLDEVGACLNVTRERVRQIEEEALLKIRVRFGERRARELFEAALEVAELRDLSRI